MARMSTDPERWPQRPSPLRTRERLLRAVHALRAAVQSARVEWKAVERDEGGEKISTKVTFRVEVTEDTLDGGFIASCLDLPGCVSQGDTEDEAVENLVEAISGVLEARMQRHLRERLPLHADEAESEPAHPHRHTIEIPA